MFNFHFVYMRIFFSSVATLYAYTVDGGLLFLIFIFILFFAFLLLCCRSLSYVVARLQAMWARVLIFARGAATTTTTTMANANVIVAGVCSTYLQMCTVLHAGVPFCVWPGLSINFIGMKNTFNGWWWWWWWWWWIAYSERQINEQKHAPTHTHTHTRKRAGTHAHTKYSYTHLVDGNSLDSQAAISAAAAAAAYARI